MSDVSAIAPTEFQKWVADADTPVTPSETPAKPAVESAEASEASTETQETPAADTEAAETAEAEAPEKKKGGFQRRIDKLTREKGEMASRLDALERQLADKPAAKPSTEQAAQPEPAGKPKPEDCKTYDEYVEKLADWTIEQRENTRQVKEQQRRQADAQRSLQDNWNQRAAEFSKEHPDYDEVIEDAEIPDTPARGAIFQALLESDLGPAIGYHLAANPDEIQRIAKLSPARAIAEIGKIEAKLSATEKPPETPKSPVSKAPKPPKPVSGSSAADADKEPDPKDFAKWSKWKDRQESLDR